MKYITEFRNQELCSKLAEEISKLAGKREMKFMEVCGTHTMAIFRYGIKSLLPANIKLISGPGCPVCVTSDNDIDKMIGYAQNEDVIIATFGDMMKVPGSVSSLSKEKSNGRDIRIVYSAIDALKIAKENPNKKVVFLGIGFETTTPMTSASIDDAYHNGIKNYLVFSTHKVMPPPLRAILESKEISIDGLILPGHVSTITGTKIYNFIPEEYKIPCCIAGFEPVDVLQSILMLVNQVINNNPIVENQYKRSVKEDGNIKAKALMNEIFEPCDAEWRGIGIIPGSGLKIREKYSDFDVEKKLNLSQSLVRESSLTRTDRVKSECICGDVIRGVKIPSECKLFRKVCNPENPVGPCMVSSEGTCSAYYKYEE